MKDLRSNSPRQIRAGLAGVRLQPVFDRLDEAMEALARNAVAGADEADAAEIVQALGLDRASRMARRASMAA